MKRLKNPKTPLLIALAVAAILWFSLGRTENPNVVIDPDAVIPLAGFETNYHKVRAEWDIVTPPGVALPVTANLYSSTASPADPYDYDDEVVVFSASSDALVIQVDMAEAGAYVLAFDQLDMGKSILTNRISVKVNGVYPFEESSGVELPAVWRFERETFMLDRYGNEIMPNSVKTSVFTKTYFYDATALNAAPLEFKLEAGENTIEIIHERGEMLLGTFYVESPAIRRSYEAYQAMHEGARLIDTLQVIGAESFTSKSNPSTRLRSERDPSATAYDTRYLRLNAIDGWSFRHGGNTITYEINAPEAGFYHLGFKYRQNYLMQMPVFREITINGEVPFDAMRMVPFHYTNNYQNLLLGDNDEAYKFYLNEGANTITLRVVLEPYRNAFENIVTIMDEITDLSLEIKRLTGNTMDRYRTWRLSTYIPDIEARLMHWIESLEAMETALAKYSEHGDPGELTNLNLAIRQLQELADDVNDIPNKMLMLADGDSSTAQLLGSTAQVLLENGLDLERLYVTGDARLPRPDANVFIRTFEAVKRFFLSFGRSDYAVSDVEEGVLEIWVNYPRQYVEIMQQVIDSEFTPETGIEVKLSIMPDENKLILANAANSAPDIALGVNHWLPYEFAIRGASLDLRQFSGYEETVSQFAPGVMIPYAFEDGMYGMPQTQNFWVTFYRQDILDALDLTVPDTWEDVIEILPELQRFGMNYFEPIAFFGGFKPFVATIPFIHQFGGDLYSEDGMSTIINSEENLTGMRMMTELFTIYNMPKQVPNFYNHFRQGSLPIGIGDLATYLQLTIAAPEIAGKWNIAPHPGVKDASGEIIRWAASGAQSLMIMADTPYPDESWTFIQWWMSTETQINFAIRLQTTYGTEFLWNTANLEAFAQLPLPEQHIEVILSQWEYAIEASRIPGAYMVEREISNAWNRIVFNDANPRITLDESVRIANREILYRMEEFGYVKDGRILKPYRVPTIHNIHEWLKEHDHD